MLFDVALTALKTLISQPSPTPPPPLLFWVGGVAVVPGMGAAGSCWNRELEVGGCCAEITPKCHRPLAGQGRDGLGRKRGGKGVAVGAWSECPSLPEGLGGSGVLHLSAGHQDPELCPGGTECGPALSTTPLGTTRTSSRTLSLMPTPTQAPALLPLLNGD